MSDSERRIPIGDNETGDSEKLCLTHLYFIRRSEVQEQASDYGLFVAVGPLTPEQQVNPPQELFDAVTDTIAQLFFFKPLPDRGGSRLDFEVSLRIKHLGAWDEVNGILLRVRFESEKQSIEYASMFFPDF